MKRFAVIGHPVGHSLSPRIHAAFGRQTGIALGYTAIDIAPETLSEDLHALHAKGYAGLNVTVPHKQTVAGLCEELSDYARHAGATNTLVPTADGWRGDNTDGVGLLTDLKHNLGLSITGKRVLIIGAGGAAHGILAPLLNEQPRNLILSSRSPDKAKLLARQFASLGRIQPCTHDKLAGESFDLVINATSAGHSGQRPNLPNGLFRKNSLAYDLNYGPACRPFLDWTSAQGAAKGYDGLGMLVEQAAESFERWNGLRPQTRAVLDALRDAP